MKKLISGLTSIFGSANERTVKDLSKRLVAINDFESKLAGLSDADLASKTDEFKQRLQAGETLDNLLDEAFGVVREAAKRTIGLRHFDVQLIGGMVLHQGKIAEMKTGEGKTLVATLAAYLNALEGKGAHIVTVNDYLARRDSVWMGKVFEFLKLTVGVIVPNLPEEERRLAYACDITYGTNNEFGFDYLRDNLKIRLEDMVQRPFHFAIVDEVDSILIDEARTPLIISGPIEGNTELYTSVNELIPNLTDDDFELDEKNRSVTLTEQGQEHIETLLLAKGNIMQDGGLYDIQNVTLVHHINQALRAHKLFTKDKDYIVKDNQVIIIDEFTGRMMQGRRFSEGLHQALEAKESVPIQMENQTLAQITFQNYFRMYPKLAGMTGTAMTEAGEFDQIYGLDVVDIPTNRPMSREDFDDEVYRTNQERDQAVIQQIKTCHEKGQPVLIGTVSIEKSEQLAKELNKAGIEHNVLNARQHEKEAGIIANAGVPGAVTLATNMAGRGTDIQLGGNLELRLIQELGEDFDDAKYAAQRQEIEADVKAKKEKALAAGGLMVIGTERHESRRIDNQLRGRSGRQGDPGASKFYVSLEDDLMRIFGSERMEGMLNKLGLDEGEAIIHPWVSKALETAQKKVEERNFEIRKQLLKFDDVMNDQRKVIFDQRKELMADEDISETIKDMRHDTINEIISRHMPEGAMPDQWDIEGLQSEILDLFGLDINLQDWADEEGIGSEEMEERLRRKTDEQMATKAASIGPDVMRRVEQSVLLQLLDYGWKDHLLQLDHLKQGIGLRAYAQRDPLNEYKREALDMFESMLTTLRVNITKTLSRIQVREPGHIQPKDQNKGAFQVKNRAGYSAQEVASMPNASEDEVEGIARQTQRLSQNRLQDPNSPPPKPGMVYDTDLKLWIDRNDPNSWGKVPRNAKCPCQSGKKYKQCHGKL